MKILILCTGNSSRSQMAHGFLKSLDNRIDVHSAGTDPASRVSIKAIAVMAEEGIDISGHFPKNADRYIAENWDYVITVCDNARETCPVFTGKVRNRMHIGFEDPSKFSGTEEQVMNEFRRIRDLIRKDFLDFFNRNLKPAMK